MLLLTLWGAVIDRIPVVFLLHRHHFCVNAVTLKPVTPKRCVVRQNSQINSHIARLCLAISFLARGGTQLWLVKIQTWLKMTIDMQ